MKRFFVLFLAVMVCLSLCVNIAFAQTQYDSYIHAYFPWFGGVTSAGAYLTNTGTVTSSDVTESSSIVLNQVFVPIGNGSMGYGMTIASNDYHVSISGTPTTTRNFSFMNTYTGDPSHKYAIYTTSVDQTQLSMRVVGDGSTRQTVRFGGFVFISGYTSYNLYAYCTQNVVYDFSFDCNFIDLTTLFGAGNEPTSGDELVSYLGAFGYSLPIAGGSYNLAPISSFSLVPQSTVIYDVDQYTHDFDTLDFEVDLSSISDVSFIPSSVMYDDSSDPYVLYGIYSSTSQGAYLSTIYYGPRSDYDRLYNNGAAITLLSFDSAFPSFTNNNYVIMMIDNSKISPTYTLGMYSMGSGGNGYYGISLPVGVFGTYDSSHRLVGISSDFLDYLNDPLYLGSDNSILQGVFSLEAVSNKEIYHTVIYSNNYVNLGTYDFNVNVVFPSLSAFNSFSGYWLGSFNTSWGEIPVRTEVQEVSSNSSSLIKIYKLTFDVPFTGQYTKFNIKYVGASNAFTTIRVDSSVIDPKAYNPTQNQVTSLNGFTGWLNGALDSLWGKIRSLFFDQDQTYEQVAQSSVSSELADDAAEVSEGASTIHEYETENFDSIETQMDSLDWDIPDDFGSASDLNSAIGFISTFFSGIFLSLGSKVQVLIVIPLMLGLCLLILGRGSQALGAINKLFR